MLHYFFITHFQFSVIVSDIKVPSLQILHAEHYRVSLCRSDFVFSWLHSQPLRTNVCLQLTWLVLPAAVWRLLLLTDTCGGSLPTRTVDFHCVEVSARLGKLPAVDAGCVATDEASLVADDADTALLDFAALSLAHRLDAGVGSPADAADDGCEAPVLTAASRSMKLIVASTAFSLSSPSNDNSLNLELCTHIRLIWVSLKNSFRPTVVDMGMRGPLTI